MAVDLVVIDSSAWIFALRPRPHPVVLARVDDLLRVGNGATVPPVRVELLGGARTAQERDRLGLRLDALLTIPFVDADWETATDWSFDLRRQGVTVPTLDLLIAAPVARVGALLLHADAHFDMLASRVGLQVESLVAVIRP